MTDKANAPPVRAVFLVRRTRERRADMVNPFVFLKERLFRPHLEPESQETVEHDVVMRMIDGKLVEVTEDDSEIREQE